MANKKFSEFTLKTDPANVDFVVGYDGTDNVRIDPSNLGGGGASSLNGLSDCLVDTASLYVGEVPSGLSGNPQGNTVLGIDAGNALTSGAYNTLIGYQSGVAINSGNFNITVGYEAGNNITSGADNVAIGRGSLNVTNGSNTVAVGYFTGALSSSANATYFGAQAGRANQNDGHISIGYQAGYSQTSGSGNTNVGYQAGYSNTTGADRVVIGSEAGKLNTGTRNVFVGMSAGQGTSSGGFNTVVGTYALYGDSAGSYNSILGHGAMATATGSNNTAVGYQAGNSITTGSNLTVIGYDADASSATATNEITLGNANITSFRIPGIQSGASDGDVLTFNSSAGKLELQAAGGGGASDLNGLSDCLVNVTAETMYIGDIPSGLSGTPSRNTVLGILAGEDITTGFNNTIYGYGAGKGIVDSTDNCMVGKLAGSAALYNFGSKNRNSYFGNSSGGSNTGGRNVGVGYQGLMSGSGSYNVAVGYSAGSSGNNGTNNTMIGYDAESSSMTVNNEITLGNSSVTALRCAVTSITSLSDERDKSEIKDLEYGLAFIDALQPREFVWDNRPETRKEVDEDGNETQVEFYSANKGKKDFGFIAQEVRELDNDTLRLVYTENEEKLEMSYGKLVPILVKAIQELKEEVELLKS
jgi:hypothetical protein